MMTGLALDSQQLIACLEALPPVELLGRVLLRQCQSTSGGWFPGDVPMAQVVQATVEMVGYGNRASQAAQRLFGLRPVPLAVSVVEFPL